MALTDKSMKTRCKGDLNLFDQGIRYLEQGFSRTVEFQIKQIVNGHSGSIHLLRQG